MKSFLLGGAAVFVVFMALSFTESQENEKQEVITMIFNEPSTVSVFSALSIVEINPAGKIAFNRIQLKRN